MFSYREIPLSPASPFEKAWELISDEGEQQRIVPDGHAEVVFSNLQHDFPKRIRYRRDGNGGLVARIEDETGKKGMDFPITALNPECR